MVRSRLLPAACVLGLMFGCEKSPTKTPGEGTYGQLHTLPSTNFVPARQPQSVPSPEGVILIGIQTGLSPATLFSTTSNQVAFFTGLDRTGLTPPRHVAFSTRNGPRAFKNGERLEPSHMEENWVLAWFAGAGVLMKGDTPWVVYLQRKPRSMRLDANGLQFRFNGAAGDLVLLPLYGSYLAPKEGETSSALFNGKPVKTWEWANILPREPLMRIRYWASALREFPLYAEETFSVDRSTDTVTIRRRTEWRAIRDDWNTKPFKLTMVDSSLAQGSTNRAFPLKFSRPVVDLHMPTSSGPYFAAEGDQPLEARLPVLGAINNAGPATKSLIETAREAYRRGDLDGYHYACYRFARELASRAPAGGLALPMVNATGKNERLIPSASPAPFVLGLEREEAGPHSKLVQEIQTAPHDWPAITLRSRDVVFGRVASRAGAPPSRVTRVPLNWNTEVLMFSD